MYSEQPNSFFSCQSSLSFSSPDIFWGGVVGRVGGCSDTDNSEMSGERRIARVHNRWLRGVILGGLLK